MGAKTEISWTDATWPVARGCDKISPGCKICWAIKDANRLQHNPNPKVAAHFQGLTQIEGGKPNWTGVVRIDHAILDWPLKWSKAKRIFVASSGDLFHEALEDRDIDHVFAVMQHAYSRGHIMQVLTKRSDRALRYLTNPLLYKRLMEAVNHVRSRWSGLPIVPLSDPLRFPMKHIHIGFSAENQQYFEARWSHMKELAKIGWLVWCSLEPLLGPVDVTQALQQGLKWVVLGGEAGPGSRPMNPRWAKTVRTACVGRGVPFLFKQWGDFAPWSDHCKPYDSPGRAYVSGDGTRVLRWGDTNGGQDLRDFAIMERVGKKKAGALLDGAAWNQFPVVQPGPEAR